MNYHNFNFKYGELTVFSRLLRIASILGKKKNTTTTKKQQHKRNKTKHKSQTHLETSEHSRRTCKLEQIAIYLDLDLE